MNLRDLRYMVAVAKFRHFGKAAEACFVSQPTLSMQLKKLEEYLGVQLFERSKKQIHLTKAGEEILVKAQRIVQEADEIQLLAKRFQQPKSGKYTLAAFPTLAPFIFPDVIGALKKQLPDMHLYLVEEKTEVLVERLTSGKIDMAFLAYPIDDESLISTEVMDDPFVVAMGAEHPLAHKKVLSMEDLRDENLLLLEEGHCLSDQALEACEWSGLQKFADFRATSIETLRQMVASGIGVTLIPQSATRAPMKGMKYIPLKESNVGRKIGLFWRKSSPYQNLFSEIADLASKAMEQH